MTDIMLPVRVDIRTGARLAPTGINPYADTVWCTGAADTLPKETREKYKNKISDLKEKMDVLASKRKEKQDGDE